MEDQFDHAKQELDKACEKLQGLLQRFLDGLINITDAECERQQVCNEVEHISVISAGLDMQEQDDPNSEQAQLDKNLQQQIASLHEISQTCQDCFRVSKLEEAKKHDQKPPVILGNSQSSDNTITPIVLDEEVNSLGILQGTPMVPSGPSPIGLDNLMQWCHYNSIMQCLCHLPPVMRYAQVHSRHHNNTQCTDLPCSLCHFHTFMDQYAAQVHPPLAPESNETPPPSTSTAVPQISGTASPALRMAHNGLLCHLSARSGGRLMIAEQQDCHETWQTLVHCCAVDHFQASGVAGGDEVAGGKRLSPLQQVFTGALQSCITCQECGRTSSTTETFSSLALQIFNPDLSDLDDVVSHFTAEEGISYKCEACEASSSDSKKKLDFTQLPDALVIQLVRFSDQHSKNGKHIAFKEELELALLNQAPPHAAHAADPGPREDRDDRQMQEGSVAPPTHRAVRYKLCGIVEHIGQSLHFGHYRALVRVPDNQHTSWFEVNDNQVTAKDSFQSVMPTEAYLLFYSRDYDAVDAAAEGVNDEQEGMDSDDALVPNASPSRSRAHELEDGREDILRERTAKKQRMSCGGAASPAESPTSPQPLCSSQMVAVPEWNPPPTAP